MKYDDALFQDCVNAFVDGQLDETACAEMREVMARDPELNREIRRLRDINDLAALAYRDCYPPRPVQLPAEKSSAESTRLWRQGWVQTLVAMLLVFVGGLGGAYLFSLKHTGHTPALARTHNPVIRNLDQINPVATRATRILIHINTMNPQRVDAALDAAEDILASDRKQGRRVKLEVVANEAGLGILREGSRYEKRIHAMLEKYNNVSFKACGIAMHMAYLQDGKQVQLMPNVHKVDAALEEIMRRLKQGWTYIRA